MFQRRSCLGAGANRKMTDYAKRRRSEGASWMTIATKLGACFETVRDAFRCSALLVGPERVGREGEYHVELRPQLIKDVPLPRVTNGVHRDMYELDDVISP